MNIKKSICAVFIIAMVALSGCKEPETIEKTVKEVKISAKELPQTTVVSRRDVLDTYMYDGQIYYRNYELSFPSEGNFSEYKVSLGDEVKKGDILATTLDSVSQKEYDALKDKVDKLKSEYEYNKQIKELELEILNIQLQQVYDALDKIADKDSTVFYNTCRRAGERYMDIKAKELELKQLKEVYDLEYPYYNGLLKTYKKTMGKNVIKSPVDGVVVALVSMQTGAYVDPDAYYIAVSDPNELCVYSTYLNDDTISIYKDKMFVRINGKDYDIEHIPTDTDAHVKILSKDETDYGVYSILDCDDNVNINDVAKLVIVRSKVENVLSLPSIALSGDSNGRLVYVMTGENEKEKRYVEIGLNNGAYAEIKSGLQEGEVVYVGN